MTDPIESESVRTDAPATAASVAAPSVPAPPVVPASPPVAPSVAPSTVAVAPSVPAPASVPAAPATVFVAPSGSAPTERFGRHPGDGPRPAALAFRPHARAPIAQAMVALGGLVISTILVRHVAVGQQEGYLSSALRWAHGLLAPARTSALAATPTGIGPRTTVIVLAATALAVLVWAVASAGLPRARNMAGTVLLLGLVALPDLFNIPMLYGEFWRADLDELRLRSSLGLVIVFVCGLARVLLAEKIWTGGQLPAPLLSLLVSLPGVLAPLLIFLPTTITVFGLDERGRGNPWWVLTSGQEDVAVALDYLWKIGLVLLLLVVTVNQARLIAGERRRARAAAEAAGTA